MIAPQTEILMPDPDQLPGAAELRQRALSRWDNEGGALASAHETNGHVPNMTSAELVQLRIRVIALKNLMITILAEGSDRQPQVAREMADAISPRPGFTHHPLTIESANYTTNFVDRAVHFRTAQSS